MEFQGENAELIKVNDMVVSVQRSQRKTMALVVERDGSITVKVPLDCQEPDISRFVEKKSLWLHQKLGQRTRMERSRVSRREFVPGESFPFLGQYYRLRLVKPVIVEEMPVFRFKRAPVAKGQKHDEENWLADTEESSLKDLFLLSQQGLPVQQQDDTGVKGKQESLRLHDGWFELLVNDKEQGRKHFIDWYKREGRAWIEADLQYYSRRVGVPVPELKVRELGYRWGSCTKNGVINLNWKVFMAPPTVVRYVLVHELVHLVEHRHNKAFWERVEMAMPDYRDKKQWLEDNGAGMEI